MPNAEYARSIPDFRVVEDDDGESLVRFEGTHQERGTNVDILTEMIAATTMNASRDLRIKNAVRCYEDGKQLAEKTIRSWATLRGRTVRARRRVRCRPPASRGGT